MRELLEAGAHFGHQTRFWSPKMSQYIFGSRNKIHIINLEKTVAKFDEAAKFLTNLAAQKGTILFVGTKRTSRDAIVAEAKRAGMPYVDQRWLGGMLTNFKTVKVSLKRLKEMEQKVADGALEKMTKKEALDFTRELEKLNKAMGGIKEMNGLPDALVVVDVGYHKIAIQEANKLGIPVVVIVDTNHSNSGKKYLEQVRIAKEILHSMRHSEDIAKIVKGLMIESYIEDGCQKIEEGVYGKSITDPCLGWEKTERLILDIAELR